mmetsp:Transcript_35565/g.78960  ORF Transcript_35565/g.78960 Transcript_35565/m.78960 type:complete len:153 (+) Transcript_35565:69-527(+)|eukprot:CAMPEP_0202893534 /NCGR_PEP_ID=MMETSP1392-20130828/3100_1 /ASSEMBLY_ACC=CAM_ASM_000868 /TAXON_ID=225041 /ORGANISM="Chlamydomonas chlamydogama, Strain SAG 11-48b" /LENGTH=152 /DNA_ID=CAMNT_0049577899 /DNA_START=46 /DNA_END=504 /DNA_ORIENTATION=-
MGTNAVASTDLKRIQEIEQNVIACIDISAAIAEELSKIGMVDQQKVTELCTEFMNNIKAAQSLVHQAVLAHTSEKPFEANCYPALARAHLAYEKAQVIASHLQGMQQVLNPGGLLQASPGEGEGGPEAADQGPLPAIKQEAADEGAVAMEEI